MTMKELTMRIRPALVVVNDFLQRYFKWAALVVVLIVLLLGWITLLQKEYNVIRTSGIIDYEKTATELEERQSYLEQLKVMDASYEARNVERLQQIETALPTNLNRTALIAQMQGLAQRANLTIIGIDVTAGSTATQATTENATTATDTSFNSSRIRTAVISMNVTSANNTYSDLKGFLATLEEFSPVLDLRTISYSPENTSFALQLYSYYVESATSTADSSAATTTAATVTETEL